MSSFTPFQQLLIRSCKVLDTHKRIDTLHRRFYLHDKDDNYDALITSNLLKVVDILGMTTRQLVIELQPNRRIMYSSEETPPYFTLVRRVLTSYIQFTEKDKLYRLGYITPARFRK